MPLARTNVFSALEAGNPIICSVKPGDFTTTGHIIVLTAIKNDKIMLHDPNSVTRSKELWDYERLEGQIKNLWVFTSRQ